MSFDRYRDDLKKAYINHQKIVGENESAKYFLDDSIQTKMTRTPQGKHYAAVGFAIHTTSKKPYTEQMDPVEIRVAQEALAGGPEHLVNAKKFATKFRDAGIAGQPDLRIDKFQAESIDMKTLILNKLAKLAMLSESDDFERLFGNPGELEARRRAIKQQELGHNTSRATAMAPPEVAPYQGGKKKAGQGITNNDSTDWLEQAVKDHQPGDRYALVGHVANIGKKHVYSTGLPTQDINVLVNTFNTIYTNNERDKVMSKPTIGTSVTRVTHFVRYRSPAGFNVDDEYVRGRILSLFKNTDGTKSRTVTVLGHHTLNHEGVNRVRSGLHPSVGNESYDPSFDGKP